MGGVVASIGHNLAGLVRFSGRDTRRQFWPYAIFLFLLSTAAFMVLAIFVAADMFGRIEHYVIAHPEGLPPPAPGQAPQIPPELLPDLSGIAMPMIAMQILSVLLLAAAVTRRLHDRDRTGLWGLMPLPFMAIGMANLQNAFAFATRPQSLTPLQSTLFAIAPFHWVALIALIVMLAGEGTKGPNRFGPEPAPAP